MFHRLSLAGLLACALASSLFIHPLAGLFVPAIVLLASFMPRIAGTMFWAGIALFAMATPVLAQAAAAASTSWDYSGFLTLADQVMVTIIIPVLGVLAAGLAAKWFKVTDAKQQEMVRDTVDNVLAKGVDYGKAFLPAGPLTVDVHNALVANILAYATQHAPDALKYFGVTNDKLKSMIIARLGAAGISVPDVPVPGPVASVPIAPLPPA